MSEQNGSGLEEKVIKGERLKPIEDETEAELLENIVELTHQQPDKTYNTPIEKTSDEIQFGADMAQRFDRLRSEFEHTDESIAKAIRKLRISKGYE